MIKSIFFLGFCSLFFFIYELYLLLILHLVDLLSLSFITFSQYLSIFDNFVSCFCITFKVFLLSASWLWCIRIICNNLILFFCFVFMWMCVCVSKFSGNCCHFHFNLFNDCWSDWLWHFKSRFYVFEHTIVEKKFGRAHSFYFLKWNQRKKASQESLKM